MKTPPDIRVIVLPLIVVKIITLGKAALSTRWGVITSEGHASDPYLLNHERIHKAQRLEVGDNAFLRIYLSDWWRGMRKYRNFFDAYMSIRFEQECYNHEHDLTYLNTRPDNAWQQYEV